jgi:hypothetical protein
MSVDPARIARRRPFVRIEERQTNGVIRGTSTPGAEIEAINLSVRAAERLRPGNETVVIARAAEDGTFSGKLPMRPHDLVSVRARDSRGTLSRSVTFRAMGLSGTPRPIHVGVFRIGLRDLGNGTVKVFNLCPSRPIAEPGAVLWIVNPRSGAQLRLVMNEKGTLQGKPRLAGAAGDVLRVESDTRPRRTLGTLLTPSPTLPRGAEIVHPGGMHQKLGFVPTLRRFDAPLFETHPRPFDVFQSELPNCYLASAAAAVAQVRPDCLERAIVCVGRGKYRVRFKDRDGRTGRYAPRDVVVTSDLYVRPSGELLYGSSSQLHEGRLLWWPVLEKAFARLRGSYRRIGRGGCSDRVLELLLGRRPRSFFVDPESPERVWRELKRTLDARLPVVAATGAPTSARKYRNTGLYPDHAYAVLGCRKARGRYVIGLRNPWGEDAGRPGLKRKNGYFEMELGQFVRFFELISSVH